MRLSARKARHLDVSEVIVFGVVSRPTLDVVACVWAAVEEGRHDLAFLFFWLWYSERRDLAPMLFRERPTVSRQSIAFDYSSPAELYLSKRGRRHTEYRRFATAAEAIGYASKNCAPSGPSPLGCRSVMSASTRTKSTDCMTMTITRCARLKVLSAAVLPNRVPFTRNLRNFDPHPRTSKKG